MITQPSIDNQNINIEELFTIKVEKNKQDFFSEILENFDFVEIQDNAIWEEILENKKYMKKEGNNKPQRFTDFTLQDVKEVFKLKSKRDSIFENINEVKPSDWLQKCLRIAEHKSLRNEKERSEILVSPIISEIQQQNNFDFKVFSGEYIDVDAERGLKGEFDFAFVNDKDTEELTTPIFTLVEAKNGDINKHWGQIAAQMVGAREENLKEEKKLKAIFGCISTGEYWHFLKLENDYIYIEKRALSIYLELEIILGIFQYIVDFYKR